MRRKIDGERYAIVGKNVPAQLAHVQGQCVVGHDAGDPARHEDKGPTSVTREEEVGHAGVGLLDRLALCGEPLKDGANLCALRRGDGATVRLGHVLQKCDGMSK